MKQQTDTKQKKQNLPKAPKKKVFRGLFVRRLIPILLASAAGFTALMLREYRTADSFSQTGKLPDGQSWYSRNRQFLESGEARGYAEEIGVPVMLRHLTENNYPYLGGNTLRPYLDISVLLFQPETSALDISRPTVGIRTVELRNTLTEVGERQFFADSAESERLADELHDYCEAHSLRINLMWRLAQRRAVIPRTALMLKKDAVPLRAAVKGSEFTALEYAWVGSSRLGAGTIISDGKPVPDGWETVTNEFYIQKGNLAYRDTAREWWDYPTDTDTAESLILNGYPSDCRAGEITQKIADQMVFYQRALKRKRENVSRIEADESGVLLKQYYKEKLKESLYDTWSESAFPTPEEDLRTFTERSLSAPQTTAVQIIEDLQAQPENRWIRYYTTEATLILKENRCTLLAVQTLDMRKYLLPAAAIYGLQFLFASLLLALLLTLPVYPKARRKQKAVEEYLRTQEVTDHEAENRKANPAE